MSLYDSVLKSLLFRLDAEAVHNLAMKGIRSGFASGSEFQHPKLRQVVFGVSFPNPLGLAAGFDKNALALKRWPSFGFGFAEIGTITLEPQPGNPRPRLFRYPEAEAIVNRMGFNNDGARVIAERIARSTPIIPIGINLGKNKDVPLEKAAEAYLKCYRTLNRYGSYFVVNVSSPNTPGLRSLQDKGPLTEIFAALKAEKVQRPLFVKIAPDLEPSAVDEVLEVVHEQGLTGIIACNTTVSREGVARGKDEAGGASGRPLRTRANQLLRYLYSAADPTTVLIGVGGIMNGLDLYDRIASGAHLCQTYTGFIYGGPDFAAKALRLLSEQMDTHGMRTLEELRGSAVKR